MVKDTLLMGRCLDRCGVWIIGTTFEPLSQKCVVKSFGFLAESALVGLRHSCPKSIFSGSLLSFNMLFFSIVIVIPCTLFSYNMWKFLNYDCLCASSFMETFVCFASSEEVSEDFLFFLEAKFWRETLYRKLIENYWELVWTLFMARAQVTTIIGHHCIPSLIKLLGGNYFNVYLAIFQQHLSKCILKEDIGTWKYIQGKSYDHCTIYTTIHGIS